MVDYFEAKSGAGWHDATLHVSKSGGNINFTVAVSNVGSWSYEGRYTARLEKMQDGRLVTIATKMVLAPQDQMVRLQTLVAPAHQCVLV